MKTLLFASIAIIAGILTAKLIMNFVEFIIQATKNQDQD